MSGSSHYHGHWTAAGLDATGVIEVGEEVRRQLWAYAQSLHLGPFDLFLVGDGLGEDYRHSAGWACLPLHSRAAPEPEPPEPTASSSLLAGDIGSRIH